MSWNIHRGKGQDGRVDPLRTLDVLRSEVALPGTGLLVLQEADEETRPHRGLLDIPQIEAATGLRYLHGPRNRRWGSESHGFLGVIIFVDPDIHVEEIALLDLPGHCHRGAVVMDATYAGQEIRVIGTHLSLGQPLRIAQMRVIGQYMRRQPDRQTVLVGDLNEWRPWGGLALSPRVVGQAFRGPATASFPVRRPFLPLDRIMTTAPGRVTKMRALDGSGIRVASDHRPIAARISVGTERTGRRSASE